MIATASREVSFHQAATRERNPIAALNELDAALDFNAADAVIMFVSTEYDLAALQAELARRIKAPMLCCTTAGEISSALGYTTGALTAAVITGCHAKLLTFNKLSSGNPVFSESIEALATEFSAGEGSPIGLVALDGLCRREESIIERLQMAMPTVPIVGGSAGDACQFKQTLVYVNGKFESDTGSLLLLSGGFAAIVFQTHHFLSTGIRVVATEVDVANRRLIRLDGLPATVRLAQVLGCGPEDITSDYLTTRPMMLRCGDTFYVRGVYRVNADGSISFFSALREGEILHIGKATEIVDVTASYFEALKNQKSTPDLVFGFDCIQRRIELGLRGTTAEMNSVLKQVPFMGFSTFGEQYQGQHVNQTMTGVALLEELKGHRGETIESLRVELEAARRTNAVLMDRLENAASPVAGVLNMNALALQEIVRQRTKSLEQMNHGLIQASTQRKRVDRILRKMQRIASIGGWELDAQTGAMESTEQILGILGLPAGTLLTIESLCAVFTPRHGTELARLIDRARKEQRTFDLEFQSAASEMRTFRVVGHPLVENGKVVRIYGVIQDITERKRSEMALEESNRQLSQISREHQLVLNSITEGIHWISRDGIILFENPASARLLGSEMADLIGKPAHATMHHSHADGKPYPQHDCPIYAGLKNGIPQRVKDEVFWRKDGTCFPVEYATNPVRDESGEIVGTVVVFSDITQRKQAEAEIERANKRLIEVSHQAGMAEVATGVLHNVGNVLNSVNVSSSLVTDHLKNSKISSLQKVVELLGQHKEDLGEFIGNDPKGKMIPGFLSQLAGHLAEEQSSTLRELEHLQKNVEHIKEIVTTQQAYASLGGFREALDLREMLEDALRVNVAAIHRHGIEVVRHFGDSPKISAEKHKVLQILINLVANAKDAMQSSNAKKLTLTVECTENQTVRVMVTDTGCGIAPENMVRVFGHGFTTKKDGHGFGLHSSALAAKEMKGSLSVYSDGLGKGATFTLELPLRVEAEKK